MIIRKAKKTDIPAIAKIHKAQFSDHFLGNYSVRLIEKFYEPFLDSCVFLVSESYGQLNGFVTGGYSHDLNQAKSKFISDNKIKYFTETILMPTIYLQALSRVKFLTDFKPPNQRPTKNGESGVRLLSIAVAENAKGTGAASKLLENFEKNLDSESYGLSVKKENERAIKFYYKNGFVLSHEKDGNLYFNKTYSSLKNTSA